MNQLFYKIIVEHVAKQFHLPTPYLLLLEEEVLECSRKIAQYLPDVRHYYAMKANPCESVVKTLWSDGYSMDVASALEIRIASSVGLSGSEMLLSSPVKDTPTLHALFQHKVSYCVVDTVEEVLKIARFRQEHSYSFKPKLFIRFRTFSKDVLINLNLKFGCDASLVKSIADCIASVQFELAGVSFHVGTKSLDSNNYVSSIACATELIEEIGQKHFATRPIINIGGGFCDFHEANRLGIDVAAYFGKIREACANAHMRGFDIFSEPGRCLVASSGIAVSSVIGKFFRDGQNWIILNDGVYGTYSNSVFEKQKYNFFTAGNETTNQADTGLTTWTVAGPTCCALDIISREVLLPSNIQEEDLIFVPGVGAYSLATASNFNGYTIPNAYMVQTEQVGNRLDIQIVGEARSKQVDNAEMLEIAKSVH